LKLISLYIENFGGLHRFSLDFEDTLTVVQQPNGFGKTTLAEFIRAMFYGFPRKAKTLDKSRRQKYTPWQGGKFGGNLVFEFQGCRYKIERTFGATPRGDSFTLIDLATGKKSTRFSENIGTELFQLDSDSFERSTYMPQLHDLTSLTTDGIQAKLGDLVEDAADMGNYEHAVAALKSARSAFVPYRGSGGSVAEAQNQISRLQSELNYCSGLETALEESTRRITELKRQQEAQNIRREDIRKRILQVSEAAAVAAAHREANQLTAAQDQLHREWNALKLLYPNGFPSEAEISFTRESAEKASILAARQPENPEDQEAAEFIEANRCRFENWIPSQDALEHCRQQITRHQTLITQIGSIGLSEEEQLLYRQLLPRFEKGELDAQRIERLENANRELNRLEHSLESVTIPDECRNRLEELKHYFAPGVPDEEEIQRHRQQLTQSYGLRREKAQLLEQISSIRPSQPGLGLILSLLAALVAAAAGIVLLRSLPVPACICIAAAAAGFSIFVFQLVKLIRTNRETVRSRGELQHRIDRCSQTIQETDYAVSAFTERYTQTHPLTDALIEIRDKRENLKETAGLIAAATAKRRDLTDQIQLLQELLTRELGNGDFTRDILNLHLSAGQFRDLRQELAAAAEKSRCLKQEADSLSAEITAFLQIYFENPDPSRFHSLLSSLSRDALRYADALARITSLHQRQETHRREHAACDQTLCEFFSRLGLSREENVRDQLLRIRDDCRRFEALSQSLEDARNRLDKFLLENRALLEKQNPEVMEDPALLQQEERQLNLDAEITGAALVRQQHQQSQIRQQLDRIPELQEELAFWQENYADRKASTTLLDDTIAILEQAREKLQTSYLEPVKTNFHRYMADLLGEDSSRILLTPDLDIMLERSGQSRELGYFSAGQTDAVMLCMRLALVDALFGETKPFVILDDPFVNLDDEHTAQALRLLKELSSRQQILYLVCNSSRV